jgi:peptidyl-prolyl cis-trans isomerase D
MTMLDRMRRHKGWLKWSLGVVVLTFVLLYVPQFIGPTATGATASGVVATVNGREIPALEYQRAYTEQVARMRQMYGDIPDATLQQLGIGQRIVEQLVNDEAVVVEAERLGFTVTDGELRARLLESPTFQENGEFVGWDRYQQMLATGRPPLRPAEYEEDVRRSLLAEKLQAAVTGWIRVTDSAVDEEYRRRMEKVKLELAVFTADKFRSAVAPTEADLVAHFDANKESYRVPEKRRVRYLAVEAEVLRSKVTVTAQEAEARYRETIQTYSTPEQIRASHILLKTEGKDEAAVRKVAEGVLARVKSGGNFATLATEFSEDDVSKAQGGDLDYFGRGAMVKEFEDAAWALQPGQVSELVKSNFGFHIIKLADRRPAITRSLDEVRSQIEDALRFEKARAEATRLAGEIAPQIKAPADLDRMAATHGLTVGDSGLFAREEPLTGIGFAPLVAAEAFALEANGVSGQLATPQGFAFIALTEVKPSYVPAVDEVREKVRTDVTRIKAVELAGARAATMAQAARIGFAAAARAAGVDVKTTELVTRGVAYPEVGVSEAVDRAVFALKAGETSSPVVLDEAVVVARVVERQDIDQALFDAERETIRTQLRQQQAGTFFSAYMIKAKEKMTIEYNPAVVQSLVGG